MKKIIKRILIKLLIPINVKIGYVKKTNTKEVNEFNKNVLLKNFYDNLKIIGFIPKHIIDVGANHGTWTRETLKHFPDSYYSLVEPQKWLKSSFQDLLDINDKVSFYPLGAGRESGSFNFTIVDRDDSCSFRYTDKEASEKGFKQIEVSIITLDELVKSTNNLPFPDIVKIDAEGLDIEVLKGASSLFGKTEIFMVEAGIVNKEFDNSFLKMMNFMDSNDYRLFEITDLNRPFKPNVLWLVELVFVKKNGIIDSFKIN
jgi:FkbM family methyltransferase